MLDIITLLPWLQSVASGASIACSVDEIDLFSPLRIRQSGYRWGTQLQTYAIEGTRLDGAMYVLQLNSLSITHRVINLLTVTHRVTNLV